jgi:hypothetical protein
MHGLKAGNWHNGGSSYIIDPSWLRIADGNNTPPDRTIEIFDAEGNKVTTLMQNNVLYTLRVYTKVGELDEIRIGQSNATMYFANVTQGVEEVVPEGPTAVEIKIGDNKADPTVFAGEETMYGFADGTKVVQMALESKADVDNKRLALTVDSSKQYLAIDFALEFALFGNIYVWTVVDGGERVLAATILAEGGIATGNLVNIAIKDSKGNDVTSQVLVGLDSGAAEKYTLYVYYNGANEVHIGCDDYDDEFGGNILYFANAECRSDA